MANTARLTVDVDIREMIADDLAGFHEWYGYERDESFRRSFERHKAGEIVYLVAHIRGRPVGHLGVDLVRVRDAVHLWQFGVLPALQSHGIGAAMVASAEEAARNRGFTIAEIGAETDNPRARALYERLGYSLIDERDGEWILRKKLP
jgi:ribosomal protein S18 acetylase RimI-like enzyme